MSFNIIEVEVVDKEEAVEPTQQVTAASIEDPAQEADEKVRISSSRRQTCRVHVTSTLHEQQVWSNNTSRQQQGAGADQSDEMEAQHIAC